MYQKNCLQPCNDKNTINNCLKDQETELFNSHILKCIVADIVYRFKHNIIYSASIEKMQIVNSVGTHAICRKYYFSSECIIYHSVAKYSAHYVY